MTAPPESMTAAPPPRKRRVPKVPGHLVTRATWPPGEASAAQQLESVHEASTSSQEAPSKPTHRRSARIPSDAGSPPPRAAAPCTPAQPLAASTRSCAALLQPREQPLTCPALALAQQPAPSSSPDRLVTARPALHALPASGTQLPALGATPSSESEQQHAPSAVPLVSARNAAGWAARVAGSLNSAPTLAPPSQTPLYDSALRLAATHPPTPLAAEAPPPAPPQPLQPRKPSAAASAVTAPPAASAAAAAAPPGLLALQSAGRPITKQESSEGWTSADSSFCGEVRGRRVGSCTRNSSSPLTPAPCCRASRCLVGPSRLRVTR